MAAHLLLPQAVNERRKQDERMAVVVQLQKNLTLTTDVRSLRAVARLLARSFH